MAAVDDRMTGGVRCVIMWHHYQLFVHLTFIHIRNCPCLPCFGRAGQDTAAGTGPARPAARLNPYSGTRVGWCLV